MDWAIAQKFFTAVLDQARYAQLLSDEHFTVDGMLIEAYASYKIIKPKDGSGRSEGGGKNPTIDFKGAASVRTYTHASVTDPDARQFRKSSRTQVKPGYRGNAMAENRSGLVVDGVLASHGHGGTGSGSPDGGAPFEQRRITLGLDKGYDAAEFVAELRALNVTPHVNVRISATF